MKTKTFGPERLHSRYEQTADRPSQLRTGTRTTVSLREGVRFVCDADSGTLLDIRDDRFHHLNTIGSRILTRMLEGNRIEEVVQKLAESMQLDSDQLLRDAELFLGELATQNLILRHEEAPQ